MVVHTFPPSPLPKGSLDTEDPSVKVVGFSRRRPVAQIRVRIEGDILACQPLGEEGGGYTIPY